MKNLLITSFSLVCLILFSNSCKEEDNTPPAISIVSPVLNDTVWSEVEIKFDATDNDGVSYVEVFANDSMVAKVSGQNTYKLNTLALKEGNNLIKCKVYDKNGNVKEDSRNIVVRNTIMTFEAGFLQGEFNLLITDSLGNTLVKTTFKSEDKLSLKPIIPSSHKSMNIFIFNKNVDSGVMYGFLNVKRGYHFNYAKYPNTGATSMVKVHLSNSTTSFSSMLLSTDKGAQFISNLTDTASGMNFAYTPGSKFYSMIRKPGGSFFKLFDITGEHLTLDMNEINSPMLKKTFSLPDGYSGSYLILLGNNLQANPANMFFLNNDYSSFNSLDLFYPAGFEKYHVVLGIRSQNKSKSFSVLGQIPDKLEFINTSVQVKNSSILNFDMTLSGEGDFYTIWFVNPNTNKTIQILSTTNITKFNMPDLGSIFQDNTLKVNEFVLRNLNISKVNSAKSNYLNPYINMSGEVNPWTKYSSDSYTFQ